MPRIFNAGDAFSVGAGTASKTYSGLQRERRARESHQLGMQQSREAQQQGRETHALRQRQDAATAEASELRIEDFKTERRIRQAQAQAELENLSWRFRQMNAGGHDAITRAARGESQPDPFRADYEAIQASAQNLPPFQREEMLAYADTRMRGIIQQRRYGEAVQAIQSALAEEVLSPEAAQQMLTELDDATLTDVSPDALIAEVRTQRNALADQQTAMRIREVTYGDLQAMYMDPNAQSTYGASDEEWGPRRSQAIRYTEYYNQHWDKIKPEEAKAQIRATLRGDGPATEQKSWLTAIENAKEDPRFLMAETQEERMAVVQDWYGLVRGNAGQVAGPLGAGAEMPPGAPGAPRRNFMELPPEDMQTVSSGLQEIVNQSVLEDWSDDQLNERAQGFLDQHGAGVDPRQVVEMKFKAQQLLEKRSAPKPSSQPRTRGEFIAQRRAQSKPVRPKLRSQAWYQAQAEKDPRWESADGVGRNAIRDEYEQQFLSQGKGSKAPAKKEEKPKTLPKDDWQREAQAAGYHGKFNAGRFRKWVAHEMKKKKGSAWKRKVKEIQAELDKRKQKELADAK